MKKVDFCPLCKKSGTNILFKDKHRLYKKCSNCGLVYVPPEFRLSPKKEKERYDLHTNSPYDLNYRRFLNKLFEPMEKFISPNSKGLDFGSGPGPTLSLMFEEKGHKMEVYDYFYANDFSVFDKTYDFITASEVLEHLFNPSKELNKLWQCLKPNGHLGIMTKLMPKEDEFAAWYYKNDPAHVCFFSKNSFEWIGSQWLSKPLFICNDIIIFTKTIDCNNHIN